MFARSRAAVIPNPVRDMSAHGGRATPEQRILAVGRLTAQKGFDVLLRAFARLAREHPRCLLTIAGEGPDLRALKAQAAGLGIADRVEFPGWIAEPGVLLERTAVFVMSSRYEGFPNALLEAMACGVPVVSTRWRGAEEMVTDGVDGLLVAVDSEIELADAIERVLKDGETRERLGRAGRTVAERYRLATIIEQWDAVLAGPARVMGSACSQKFYS
jgi:glycosyltransferase involved in cell wall biosynthesis